MSTVAGIRQKSCFGFPQCCQEISQATQVYKRNPDTSPALSGAGRPPEFRRYHGTAHSKHQAEITMAEVDQGEPLARKLTRHGGVCLTAMACAILWVSTSLTAQDDARPLAALTDLQQIRKLGPYEADQNLPVDVTATVLFAEPAWQSLCIHDGTTGVMVFDPQKHEVRAGQKVRITGRTVHQTFATHLEATTLKVVGPGDAVPQAQKLSGALQQISAAHGQWVEFEGVIVRDDRDEQRAYLHLAGREFPVFAIVPRNVGVRRGPIPDFSPENAFQRRQHNQPLAAQPPIEGCRIKLRGVCVLKPKPGGNPDIEVWVPDGSEVAVGPGPGGKENPAGVRVKDLQWFDVNARETAAVQTRVTVSFVDGRRLFVTDGTGHTLVESERLMDVAPGDLVRVKGIATWNGQKAHITRAEVIPLGKYRAPEIIAVPATEASGHFGEVIEVEATVAGRRDLPSGDVELLMHDETIAFPAVIPGDMPDAAFAREGTRLKLSGACWHSTTGEYPFALAVGSIRPLFGVASGPPAWSVHVLIVSAVLLVVTGFLIWLHWRREAEQRRFYIRVHEQLDGMAHVSRVNTLAEMVGALSHELSQPLASMSNFASAAESLGDRMEDSPPQLLPIIGRIKDEAHRANELIRRLRMLTRPQTRGRESVDLDAVVVEAVELFRFGAPARTIVVDVDLHGALPEVCVDSIQLEQVLLNLMNNARDATLGLDDRRPRISIGTRVRDDSIEILVEDNGSGMTEKDCRTAFEPYVTTKSEGTGLGLAISRTIVESHGGTIVAEPVDPHGTRLRIALPVAATASRSRRVAG